MTLCISLLMVYLADIEQSSYFCDQSVNIFVFFKPAIVFLAEVLPAYVET